MNWILWKPGAPLWSLQPVGEAHTNEAPQVFVHDLSLFVTVQEAVQGLSDLFNIRLQNDDVQDLDVRWDQDLLSASDLPSDVILEGLYKSKLQDTVQLQTVLALYDQETVRNNGQTSYSRLKTDVGKTTKDQKRRIRNFRVRSEVVERGTVTKSQKGKKDHVERRVVSGKHMDNVPKETHVVSVMTDWHKETWCSGQGRTGRSSSPATK